MIPCDFKERGDNRNKIQIMPKISIKNKKNFYISYPRVKYLPTDLNS